MFQEDVAEILVLLHFLFLSAARRNRKWSCVVVPHTHSVVVL